MIVYHCADDLTDPKLLVRYHNCEKGKKVVRYCSIGAAALMGAYIDGPKNRKYRIETLSVEEATKYLQERHSINCGAGI